jgi:hypothetical protein
VRLDGVWNEAAGKDDVRTRWRISFSTAMVSVAMLLLEHSSTWTFFLHVESLNNGVLVSQPGKMQSE